MSGAITTAIIAVKTVILLLGGSVSYIAFKAYRRSGEPSLRYLAVGFGIVTLGALSAGIANLVFGEDLQLDVLINSVLVAIGLVVVLYSLYAQE